MIIQLGRDDYPILDQFSEEGFVDLTFRILDLFEDTDCYKFNMAASFEDQVCGIGVVVKKGIKSGFDGDMNLIKEHVYHEGVKFFSAGERSNLLVAAIGKLYQLGNSKGTMVSEERFTAIALHQGDLEFDAEAVKIKIFGRDQEGFDEDDYYESFFNVDLLNRMVFWNEKDQGYRIPLIRALRGSKAQDAEQSVPPKSDRAGG